MKIGIRIYNTLAMLYPDKSDHELEVMTGSGKGMVSKIRTGKCLGLNIVTWISLNHPEYEQLRVDAYQVNSANRAKGSKRAQLKRKKKPKAVNISWPAPIPAMPYNGWEC